MASQKEAFMAKWTESLTNLYVSLLVEEVKKGNRTSSSFNKAGWNNIRTEFNKRTGRQYTQLQLKNKDNSEWAKFKKDGFPQYPDLCFVFGDTYATGEHAAGDAEDLVMSDELGIGGNDVEDGREDHVDEGVFMSDKTPTPVHDKHRIDKTPNSKRRRRSHSFGVASTCKAIQEMIKIRTSQLVSGSVNSQVTSPLVDPFSISAVIDVLVAMPTLEQDLYNKAVERACDSAAWREAFIISPTERRYGLLQYQITTPPVDPFSVSAVIDVLVAMPTLEQDLYNKAVERACDSAAWREAFIKSPSERRYELLQ